jgi:nitrate reductase cytochrome c-type subunit
MGREMSDKLLNKLLTPVRWIKEGVPLKGKIIIAILLLFIIIGSSIVAFKFYDFTQNNPKFCVSCHLMEPAFEAWQKSEHAALNCHDCHHLSIQEQNRLLINFILYRPASVPERHGKVIVPWKFCMQCHWEKNEKYQNAPMINRSRYHAKHVFMEKIECSKCHGYRVHKFTVEERYCMTCHKEREVHGTGMEKLACLNCHTDRTKDLKPGRKKCLFCHGDKSIREELIADGTIDVKHFQPSPGTIKKAIKVNVPADAPMQFYCYECHKPHAKVRPDWGDCLTKCHSDELYVGKHEMHVKTMGMKCTECHKPHAWRVSEAQAKKDCIKCHEYKGPMKFMR